MGEKSRFGGGKFQEKWDKKESEMSKKITFSDRKNGKFLKKIQKND